MKIHTHAPWHILLVAFLVQEAVFCNGFYLGRRSSFSFLSSVPLTTRTTTTRSDLNQQLHQLHQQQGDYLEYIPPPQKRGAPQGGDMAYIQVNIQRQMDTYSAIRNVGGLDCVRDVYVSSPLVLAAPSLQQQQASKIFWYVGKVALAGVSVEEAIARQRNLIEEHAARLRPVELGRSFGELEFFIAPGDSETQVENNLQRLELVSRVRLDDIDVETVARTECGFLCEVVTSMGVGFHVERALDGSILDD